MHTPGHGWQIAGSSLRAGSPALARAPLVALSPGPSPRAELSPLSIPTHPELGPAGLLAFRAGSALGAQRHPPAAPLHSPAPGCSPPLPYPLLPCSRLPLLPKLSPWCCPTATHRRSPSARPLDPGACPARRSWVHFSCPPSLTQRPPPSPWHSMAASAPRSAITWHSGPELLPYSS